MKFHEAFELLKKNNLQPHPVRYKNDESWTMIRSSIGYTIVCMEGFYEVTLASPSAVLCHSTSFEEIVDALVAFYKSRDTSTDDGLTTEDGSQLLEQAGLIVSATYDEVIWGHIDKCSDSMSFTIKRFEDAWLAMHIPDTGNSDWIFIKYSRSLEDIVNAVVSYFDELRGD